MNKLMEAALSRCLGDVQESLPEYILKQYGLVPIHFALRNIHFPKDMAALEKAKYRLKFEELFYLQLSLLKQKSNVCITDSCIIDVIFLEIFSLVRTSRL